MNKVLHSIRVLLGMHCVYGIVGYLVAFLLSVSVVMALLLMQWIDHAMVSLLYVIMSLWISLQLYSPKVVMTLPLSQFCIPGNLFDMPQTM